MVEHPGVDQGDVRGAVGTHHRHRGQAVVAGDQLPDGVEIDALWDGFARKLPHGAQPGTAGRHWGGVPMTCATMAPRPAYRSVSQDSCARAQDSP